VKAAMLIEGVKSTYVFESALESLERWFGDGRYSENGMSPPIWVEKSEDENAALIIYNGGINNGKHPRQEIYDADFFTESYSDSKINSIFSACMDPTNKSMMSETEGVYFVNENSTAKDIKDFANKVKMFAARTIMNPASIIAMESRTEDLTMFKILAAAAAESEKVALEIALENARKHKEAMGGLEEYSDFDRDDFDRELDILNSKPTEVVDPTTFEEPEGLDIVADSNGESEVRPEDLDASDFNQVPVIQDEEPNIVEEEHNIVEDDLKPSEVSISDSEPLDDKEVAKPVETPKNSLLEALTALQERMGITEAEFISRLEKVMLIGKLAGGPQSAAVEEEKAPLAENAVPDENNVEESPAVAEGRGGDGLHYIDTPDGVVSNISADDLFGDDYDDEEDKNEEIEKGADAKGYDDMDRNGESDKNEAKSSDLSEDSEDAESNQETSKEINESLPADELIKELANESKNDDEFFDMLIKRRTKFGLPTLIKAANIDMRNYILTGVESAVEADVKSKRVALI
jgi:hypothetical protein